MKKALLLAATLLLPLALATSTGGTETESTETTGTETGGAAGGETIVDLVLSDPNFSTLATALEAAGLTETLSGEGPFTVFAPTNDAFDALPEGELDALLADPTALSDVLLYHVVEGELTSDQLADGDALASLQGGELSVSVTDSSVTVGGANVTSPDLTASNGVVHAIDTVLLPSASADGTTGESTEGAEGTEGTEGTTDDGSTDDGSTDDGSADDGSSDGQ